MGDSRRAEIIRAIADAEASHRERIEKRLRELGQPVPDPSSVKLSTLQRLQARLAPVDMVIRRMEAAEEVEITDRYKRSTGDPDTDAVLEAIGGRGHGGQRRERAAGDRRAPRRGEGGGHALLPAEGDRQRDGGPPRRAAGRESRRAPQSPCA